MRDWIHDVYTSFDAQAVARALWRVFTGDTIALPETPAPTSVGSVTHNPAPGLRVVETSSWRMTRDEEVLVTEEVTYEATPFSVVCRAGSGRVVVRADEPLRSAAIAAVFAALGVSQDESDALDALASKRTFTRDSFDNRYLRLVDFRYGPRRLAGVIPGDAEELARLDRIARDQPDLVAAPLCAALLLAASGRPADALARLDEALRVPRSACDLALARIDVLSRLGRHLEAEASLAALPPLDQDPLAQSAMSLAVAVHRRAGHPRLAAEAAMALLLPLPKNCVLFVFQDHARLVAARCFEEAGELDAAARVLGALTHPVPTSTSRPGQWFLAEHVDSAWLQRVAASAAVAAMPVTGRPPGPGAAPRTAAKRPARKRPSKKR